MANERDNPMDECYSMWVKRNVGEIYGKCAEITRAMAGAFPELTRVRGHYYCPSWGERSHWWLVGADGQVVDPTAGQFPSKGRGHYEPWGEGNEEPTGMCPNCGEHCYKHHDMCSDACGIAYAAYLNQCCW